MRPEVFHVAFTHVPIDRVYGSGMNSDQDFTLSRLRTRRVFVLENLRAAVGVNPNRFHGLRVDLR
jgi:hypothetical protein